jgi:hypothetical protein
VTIAEAGTIRSRRARRGAGRLRLVTPLVLVAVLPSCATLRSMIALSEVRFSMDRVHEVQVAGVPVDGIRSYGDLGASDVLRVGSAVSRGTVPLEVTLELSGQNPEDNPEARMVALDWTLFLRDRETVSGVLDREVLFAPGEATSFPLRVSLDLMEFFQGSARDLVEVALALAGPGGEPAGVRLEVLPTVETRLGPIRYPRPLVLER